MVTHDPVAASYADRVLLLADGRVADDLPAAGADAIAERLVPARRARDRGRAVLRLALRMIAQRPASDGRDRSSRSGSRWSS